MFPVHKELWLCTLLIYLFPFETRERLFVRDICTEINAEINLKLSNHATFVLFVYTCFMYSDKTLANPKQLLIFVA